MAFILVILFPMAVIIGCCGVAWLLGTLLTSDAEKRYEGSELIELNS